EPDRRHPDPAPLLGDEHAEEPELAHLAEQVGRADGALPRLRRPAGDLLGRELAAQLGEVVLTLGQGEIHALRLMRYCSELDQPVGTHGGRPWGRPCGEEEGEGRWSRNSSSPVTPTS